MMKYILAVFFSFFVAMSNGMSDDVEMKLVCPCIDNNPEFHDENNLVATGVRDLVSAWAISEFASHNPDAYKGGRRLRGGVSRQLGKKVNPCVLNCFSGSHPGLCILMCHMRRGLGEANGSGNDPDGFVESSTEATATVEATTSEAAQKKRVVHTTDVRISNILESYPLTEEEEDLVNSLTTPCTYKYATYE